MGFVGACLIGFCLGFIGLLEGLGRVLWVVVAVEAVWVSVRWVLGVLVCSMAFWCSQVCASFDCFWWSSAVQRCVSCAVFVRVCVWARLGVIWRVSGSIWAVVCGALVLARSCSAMFASVLFRGVLCCYSLLFVGCCCPSYVLRLVALWCFWGRVVLFSVSVSSCRVFGSCCFVCCPAAGCFFVSSVSFLFVVVGLARVVGGVWSVVGVGRAIMSGCGLCVSLTCALLSLVVVVDGGFARLNAASVLGLGRGGGTWCDLLGFFVFSEMLLRCSCLVSFVVSFMAWRASLFSGLLLLGVLLKSFIFWWPWALRLLLGVAFPGCR
ncbi:hypothetical protein SAMN02745168_2234 [Papillibacter cinnamivorans DSM 12816]|uniref:Uncharacterized protein n=1 Tax=Papillibacter cinnamivorans DSM 12816 TaxID=1122930 RepID=A0A1W2BJD8_9FIRM|nr:hypothetical protein SAMN02745168_2234 [Papillibacter cinnamivorans DSM 12816]